jgi:hypothetical protein
MADRQGWEVRDEFYDEDASAWTGNRGPDLEAAQERAAALVAEDGSCVLLTQHPDRLARGNVTDAAHLVEYVIWARKTGVELCSVQAPDTFRDLIHAVLMGERNWEDSKRKSEAVGSGKRRAFERGEPGGGQAPDGFEVLRDVDERGSVRRTYRLQPERAPIIELIYELHELGWGRASIVRELNRRGLRTQAGRPWDPRSVDDKLTNPAYAGAIVWHRGEPDQEINWNGQYPRLIEPERWRRLMAAREARDKARGSNRSPRGRNHSNHALARLARCLRCGEPMRPVTGTYRRKRDGGRRRTYLCASVHGQTGLCDQPSIDAEAVDAHVVAALERYLGNFERWREQIASSQESEQQKLQRQVDQAREELTALDRNVVRLEAHAERYLEAGEGEKADAVFELLARRREERGRVEARMSATEGALEAVPSEVPTDAMLDFYNALQAAVRGRLEGADTMARVNDALRDLFQAFYLDIRPDDAGVQVLPVLLGGRFDWPQTAASIATGGEAIRPPLRVLEAPSGKSGSSQA